MNRTFETLGRTLLALSLLALALPLPAAAAKAPVLAPQKAPAKKAPAKKAPAKKPPAAPTKAPSKATAKEPVKAPGAAVAKTPPWKDDDCIIKAGPQTLTYADIKKIYALGSRDDRPLDSFPPAEQERVFKKIYNEWLLAAEARSRGLHETQGFLDRTLAARDGLLLPVLKTREYVDKVKPTDAELLQYLPPAEDEVQVRILVKESADEAKRLYERALAGEDFDQLVRAESEGNLRQGGGLTGFLSPTSSKGKFPPPVIQRFLDAPVGKVLEPFYQDIGFLVVKIEAKRTAEELRQQELVRKRQEVVNYIHKTLYGEWLKKVQAAAAIVVHDEAVEAYEKGKGDPEAVVLEVNGDKFRGAEIFGAMAQAGHSGQPMRQRAEGFIETALVGQEARKLGLDKDPEYLEQWTVLERRALAQELMRVELEPIEKGPVTDEELEEYRKSRSKRFMDPEARRVRLLLANDEDTAVKAVARAKKGEDFGALVKEFSADADSRAREGDMGYQFAREMPPVVAERAFALKVGDVTDPPIKAEAADTKKPLWLVVRLEGVRDAAPTPLDRVRTPKVESEIRTLKRAKRLQSLTNDTAKKFGYALCNPLATDRKE